ncbi:hypothetical protein CLAVI_000411 [Candidatus Clavichlamydia salmonicola]|uniref:hypothetical protein n=1 Tax=Candidatus Clavichlamydia salmonicola TaxID=469812 RepID=UPI001891F022|nr:hypothetical protein [Candidatus Clavichlamydia salmonicola]MBF5050792.1 hypothetical protein [Candidatus Clavichlamydia salmonicola]
MSSITGGGNYLPADNASLGGASSLGKSGSGSLRAEGKGMSDKLRAIWKRSSEGSGGAAASSLSEKTSITGSLKNISFKSENGKAKGLAGRVLKSFKKAFTSGSSSQSSKKPELLEVPPPTSPRLSEKGKRGVFIVKGNLPEGFEGAIRQLEKDSFKPKVTPLQGYSGGKSLAEQLKAAIVLPAQGSPMPRSSGNAAKVSSGTPSSIVTGGRPVPNQSRPGTPRPIPARGTPKPIPLSTAGKTSGLNPNQSRLGTPRPMPARGAPKPIPLSTASKTSGLNPSWEERKLKQGKALSSQGPGTPKAIPPKRSKLGNTYLGKGEKKFDSLERTSPEVKEKIDILKRRSQADPKDE